MTFFGFPKVQWLHLTGVRYIINRSHVGLELTSVACVAMLLVPDSGAFGRVCRLCAYIVFKNISPPVCYRYNLILMSNFLKI